jgi:hypothetical protein
VFGETYTVPTTVVLVQACTRYEAAWRLRESSHAALYNWGVALSDLARVGEGPARTDFLLAAAEKYAESLKWNPNNPQVRPPRSPTVSPS